MRTSRRQDYFVIEWPHEIDDWFLAALVEDWPTLVEGKHVVITSIDSGSFKPSEAELARGWRTLDRLSLSPRIESWRDIPMDMYDEWYVFDAPVRDISLKPSVNYQGFSPIDYDWTEKLDQFWRQIFQTRPLHVIGDGTHLYLVTRDERIYNEILTKCRTSGCTEPGDSAPVPSRRLLPPSR